MTNPFYKIAAVKMRKDWSKNDALRNSKYSIPDSVVLYDDISYGKYKDANLLCVYKPKARHSEKLPCIVNFHGGGFFYGDKEVYQFYSAELAAQGFAVVTFNYRLAPEHKYPKQLEDINNVMKWISVNGKNYGLDTENLFFVGDSAGGRLVYDYTVMVTNPQYAKMFNIETPGLKPKAVGLNCGVYDFDLMTDKMQLMMIKSYTGSHGLKKYAEHLKTKNFLTADFPPAFVMSASHDFCQYQLKPMVELLKSKGIKTVSKIYGTPEDQNAFHVFHVDIGTDLAKECNQDECNFFKSFISG